MVQDQSVDALRANPPENVDPELFTVLARLKDAANIPAVQKQMIAAVEGFATTQVDAAKLNVLKEHIRYEFALQLNNSESVAQTVGQFVALRRTPESMNRYYDEYAKLTPADIQRVAKKYLVEQGRTVVTFTSAGKMKHLPLAAQLAALLTAGTTPPHPKVVELPGKSPLVTIRFVFTTGAAGRPRR